MDYSFLVGVLKENDESTFEEQISEVENHTIVDFKKGKFFIDFTSFPLHFIANYTSICL